MSACPVSGCGREMASRPSGAKPLLCPRHWRMVRHFLRLRIVRLVRKFEEHGYDRTTYSALTTALLKAVAQAEASERRTR